MDKNSILERTREVARAFIAGYFDDESSLFDVFWAVFSSRWDFGATESSGTRSAKKIEAVIREVSFANDNAVDLVTPVILATVAETARKANGKSLSVAKIEEVVGGAAKSFGASVELVACLVRHLPILCQEAFIAKDDAEEATVSKAPTPRFRIWTGGESKIVASIDEYEKRKEDFLFWIDLDEKAYVSPVGKKPKLGTEATKIFLRLVESLGTHVPVTEFLGERYDTSSDAGNTDKNKIEQQLTKLHQFSNGQFRGFLFRNWFRNGLGLKESFADKYFLFSRLENVKL